MKYCISVDIDRRFGGTYLVHLHGRRISEVINQRVADGRGTSFRSASCSIFLCLSLALKMTAVGSSIVRCHISEGMAFYKVYQKSLNLEKILQKFETFRYILLKTTRVKYSMFTNNTMKACGERSRALALEVLTNLRQMKEPKSATRQ